MSSRVDPPRDPIEAEQLADECRRWRWVALVSALGVVTVFFAVISAILCHSATLSAEHGNAEDARAKLRWGQGLALAGVSIAMLTAVAFFATR